MPADASPAETEDWDVVIAGAGPVGLSLALGLAQRGRRVLVLEQEPGTSKHSRAPAIWPGTQQILANLGQIDRFLNEGILVQKLKLWDIERKRVLFSAPLEELAERTPFPHLLILPQSDTERLLLEAVQREPTAEVQFSSEVTGFDQGDSQVAVHYQFGGETKIATARYLAGCDGAHSIVREKLGASFEGITYKVQAALADIEIADSQNLRFPRLCTRPFLGIGIRLKGDVWRLILPFPRTDQIPLDERVAGVAKKLFDRDYRPVWQSEFHLHRRVSSIFAEGRVVLAGDAAHLNSPVGGQGMNAGIQDAALLTEAMHEALEKDANDSIPNFAEARRKEVQTGVNRFTNLLTRVLLFRRGRLIRPVLRLANLMLRVSPLRRRFLRNLAMLDE